MVTAANVLFSLARQGENEMSSIGGDRSGKMRLLEKQKCVHNNQENGR